VVWPAGKNDLGSQGGGQETKMCALFCTEFKAERGRGVTFPRELARSPSNDFEAALDVGGSAGGKCGAPGGDL